MPVHYMSCRFPLLVTAHQDRLVTVWNLEDSFRTGNFEPKDVVETSLKYSTTTIECFADGKGFCVGSIEGRCSVNNMDFSKSDRGKSMNFCFKCHRVEDPNNK